MAIDVKDLRRRLGGGHKPISQAELGKKLGGVSQSTVSRLEDSPDEQTGPIALLLEQLDRDTPLYPKSDSAEPTAREAAA